MSSAERAFLRKLIAPLVLQIPLMEFQNVHKLFSSPGLPNLVQQHMAECHIHGVLLTADGAQVMFSFRGRTFFEGEIGKQLLTVTFEADDERYRWLNTSFCVLEGVIDGERLSMRARVYACVNDLV